MVATAFPPLKFAKIGKQCPAAAESPAIIMVISLFAKKEHRKIAKVTFKISSVITASPAFFPSTLPAFPPPKFLLPYRRMSFLKNTFPITNANGIEPKKYPIKTDVKISIIILSLVYFLIACTRTHPGPP